MKGSDTMVKTKRTRKAVKPVVAATKVTPHLSSSAPREKGGCPYCGGKVKRIEGEWVCLYCNTLL